MSVPASRGMVLLKGSRLIPFVVLLMGLAQYLWLGYFYDSIAENISRDMESYRGSIEGLADEPFTWDLISAETIAHRTSVYGEYLASIIFQVTGALGGTPVELHTATITILTLTGIFFQLNRKPTASLALLLTLACPFLFSNLLLGNTRQLWACIWILLFYGRTPLFEFFAKNGVSRPTIYLRAAFFFLLILGTHMGSLLIFANVLVIDYLAATFAKDDRSKFASIRENVVGLAFAAAVGIAGYAFLGDGEALSGLQSKVDFYTSERGLHTYPYLTGGFFYLVILPLFLDVFNFLKRDLSTKAFRFSMSCIGVLLLIAIVLPFSHALDRVLTSLFLLAYVRRLSVGDMHIESIMVPARLGVAVYYILTR